MRLVAPRELLSVSGEAVPIPDPDRLVHLQLRRFAGCPICNLHLQSIVRRHNEIAAAGVREVVVFHSTDEELRRYAGDLPFAVVGDPTKALYDEFGVGTSPRSVLHPRALASALRGGVGNVNMHPTGGHLGLPADFLISADGRVLACKRGRHANDQWTVDEVLAHARSENA
ncbi:peroxiredoxin-like family protein [Mycobacterium sp. E3198]|uniref:peroxiredoxin-like family protein n=1 Tax=Mycobacterium sp. E3198 TaxID=1834143 RepID=UPI0007FF2E38|nr:peroxiredoxin-like family protein [Mycobacterium sp. E3198]OBG31705.1 alkyl hydroperoxide reductase [Mycobacterium sp. E3198]